MLLIFSLLFLCPLLQGQIIRRVTKHGTVHGIVYATRKGNKGEKYLGLPYARQPVGQFRFEYPVPLNRWPKQPCNATYERSRCIQHIHHVDKHWTGNEDCLYLNIFKPAAPPNRKFPVLFWIHGGSYEAGSGNQFDVDGAIDNFASQGMVLVTINYRLGVLGFMSLFNESLPGNYGLEDQLQALRWVNANIEDFGGDKKSITICGESAGGASVNLLTLSPKAQGLFHRAIIISGAAVAPWAIAPKTAKSVTEDLINRLRCRNTRTVVDCLKQTSVFKLLNTYKVLALLSDGQQSDFKYHTFRLTPIVDYYRRQNAILPLNPRELAKKTSLRTPVLMGLTTGELPGRKNLKWEELLPLSRLKYGAQSLDIVNQTYLKANLHHSLEDKRRQIYNDYMINVPMCLTAKLLEQQGSKVYFYLYDLRDAKSEGLINIETNNLPCHGADVAFLFNDKSLIPNQPPNESLPSPCWPVRSMIFDSFRNFVKTGNPNQPTKLSRYWTEYAAYEPSSVVWFKNDKVSLTNCYEQETKLWKFLDWEYALL